MQESITQSFFMIEVQEEAVENPSILKKIEALNEIEFDADMRVSILDNSGVCELVRLIGAGYIRKLFFYPALMGCKPALELALLKRISEDLQIDVEIELSYLVPTGEFETTDIIAEMLPPTAKKIKSLLGDGAAMRLLNKCS